MTSLGKAQAAGVRDVMVGNRQPWTTLVHRVVDIDNESLAELSSFDEAYLWAETHHLRAKPLQPDRFTIIDRIVSYTCVQFESEPRKLTWLHDTEWAYA